MWLLAKRAGLCLLAVAVLWLLLVAQFFAGCSIGAI